MNYFTADWHHGHKKIIEYCDRPFSSVDEQEEVLLENLLLLKDTDTLYVLGDCFLYINRKKMRDFLSQIRGRKILVRGNHDRGYTNKKMLDVGFDEVHKFLEIDIAKNKLLLTHDPVSYVAYKGLVLCGHVHTMWKQLNGVCLNVGVDMWDFKPVSEHQIKEWIENETTNKK